MLLCLQLPVKMVRCGQHATLAVQLAASSAPLWGRKSTSSAAVPTIAEEDASCAAYPGAASPPLAAPLTMPEASFIEGGTTPVLASAIKPQAQPASLPGHGVLQAGSTALQSRAGPTLQEPAVQNGNHGHTDISKERPTGPVRERDAQQLPSRGAGQPAVPASEVFREPQPCRRPAKPLQGSPDMPSESISEGLHANESVSGSCSPGSGFQESSSQESSSYIEGRVGGSHVKLAQLHPPGSMAAQSQMLSDSAGGHIVPPSNGLLCCAVFPGQCTLDCVLSRLHALGRSCSHVWSSENAKVLYRDPVPILECLVQDQSRAPFVVVSVVGLTDDGFQS